MLVREVVEPRWPAFRLGPPTMDGLTRRRGNGLVRLLHVDGAPVVVAVSGTVFAARAATEAAAREGIARMRFATGIDDDLEDFHARFRDDPVLGRAIRARPWLRVRRNPDAVRGAHLGDHRAADRARPRQGHPAPPDRRPRPAPRRAERRPGRRDGRGPGAGGDRRLRPGPEAHPRAAPGARVAAGESRRARERRGAPAARDGDDVAAPLPRARSSPRRATSRLLAIPEIGTWTVECLALYGLGRLDVVPAGDLGYLKLVGRLSTGNPRAIADEDEVRGFFSAYAPYAGMAALYLSGPARTLPAPRPGGTRWSAGSPRRAAA